MSDLTIIGIIVFLMVVGGLRIGWRVGVHLNAPPRSHDRSDEDIDKIVEDRVEAALARRGTR